MTQPLTYGIFCDIILGSDAASTLRACQRLVRASPSKHAGFEFAPFFMIISLLCGNTLMRQINTAKMK